LKFQKKTAKNYLRNTFCRTLWINIVAFSVLVAGLAQWLLTIN